MSKPFSIAARILALLLSLALLAGCGIRRKKYETPIATDSKQPDKTLFDRAVNDIEKSRYEVARLTLQTLINTYPDSEYLAKAKLAIADAWYRQGGTTALAQAEAEYKDFITFFPTMPEASEAQLKVAMIHYQQMEKPDRDSTHARRAEDEFKQLLLQFPDSPFKEEAEQRLREVQEVIAEHEYRVGRHYFIKGNPRAAISRLKELSENYPNYSVADHALWMLGESYEFGGKDFRPQAAAAYARIVSDYPLSDLVDSAKEKLTAWNMAIPQPKPEAYARMKYDLEHRETTGMWGRATAIFRKRPDVSMASKAGTPVLVPTARPTEEAGTTALGASGAGTSGIRLEPVQPGTEPVTSSAPTPAPAPASPTPPAQPAPQPPSAGGAAPEAAPAATAAAPAAVPPRTKPSSKQKDENKSPKKKADKKKK